MIEYPSIINSSKAPRKSCIAFDKLDVKNTQNSVDYNLPYAILLSYGYRYKYEG